MAPIEIHLTDLAVAAKSIPENTPVVMINLIKFKPQTTYPEGSPHSPLSGQEAYLTRYGGAFFQLSASMSSSSSSDSDESEKHIEPVKPLFLGKPQANLIAEPYGGKEVWDMVGIIWYPNFATFRTLLESNEYQEQALPHRLASIEEYRLYVATELSM